MTPALRRRLLRCRSGDALTPQAARSEAVPFLRKYFFIWARNPTKDGEKVAVVTYLMEGVGVGEETSRPLFFTGHRSELMATNGKALAGRAAESALSVGRPVGSAGCIQLRGLGERAEL